MNPFFSSNYCYYLDNTPSYYIIIFTISMKITIIFITLINKMNFTQSLFLHSLLSFHFIKKSFFYFHLLMTQKHIHSISLSRCPSLPPSLSLFLFFPSSIHNPCLLYSFINELSQFICNAELPFFGFVLFCYKEQQIHNDHAFTLVSIIYLIIILITIKDNTKPFNTFHS